MNRLHKLSEWRPDMPQRITGLTMEDLEALDECYRLALGAPSVMSARRAEKANDKIKAEIERRKNGR